MEEKGEKEVMDATAYICKLRSSFEINFLKDEKFKRMKSDVFSVCRVKW